jgi:hypothetical protein
MAEPDYEPSLIWRTSVLGASRRHSGYLSTYVISNIERHVQPSVPPRVDYSLTPLGESYIEPLQALLSWGAKHQDRIAVIRRAYDAEQDIKAAG